MCSEWWRSESNQDPHKVQFAEYYGKLSEYIAPFVIAILQSFNGNAVLGRTVETLDLGTSNIEVSSLSVSGVDIGGRGQLPPGRILLPDQSELYESVIFRNRLF